MSELQRFEVKAHELLRREAPWGYSERFQALMRFQAERAHATYDEALAMQVAAFVRQDAVRLFEALLVTLRERSA